MGYRKAAHVLPADLLERVQEYVEGAYIYIPRVDGRRREWGADTDTRRDLCHRNSRIYEEYKNGRSAAELAETYYLSLKSIQRIIRQKKIESNII